MKKIRLIIAVLGAFVLFSGIAFAQTDTTIIIKTSAQCERCKSKIENDLSFEKGVKKVKLDLKTNMLTVVYRKDKSSADKIRTALTKIGYDADTMPADTKAYDKLEKCCKKDSK